MIVFALVFVTAWSQENSRFRELGVVVERTDLISESSIDKLLGNCIKYRIGTLYIPVVSYMEALYDSKLLPRSNVLINNKTPLDFDPISYIMEKGETFGVKIVLTIDPLTVWPGKDLPVNALHISNSHSDWLSRDSMGMLLYDPVIMDPGVPEVQSFIIAVFKELMLKYNPTYIAIDSLEYPDNSYGYNPYAMKSFETFKRQNFNKPINIDDYRVHVLSDIVSRINEVRDSLGVRTRFYIFCNSDPELSKKDNFQDWVVWVNSGDISKAIMWYWYPDVRNVRYDTSRAEDNILSGRFIPALSPLEMGKSQFTLIMKNLLEYDFDEMTIDVFDRSILETLNSLKVGVPR